MLDAGVLVGTLALVAFAWNLTRINDVMKAWSVKSCETNDPVAYCLEKDRESQLQRSSTTTTTSSHGNESQTAGGVEDGPEPTEQDVATIKVAKYREHFEGKVPGELTPPPWRTLIYGRGRPSCVRRRSSLSASGYNMIG